MTKATIAAETITLATAAQVYSGAITMPDFKDVQVGTTEAFVFRATNDSPQSQDMYLLISVHNPEGTLIYQDGWRDIVAIGGYFDFTANVPFAIPGDYSATAHLYVFY